MSAARRTTSYMTIFLGRNGSVIAQAQRLPLPVSHLGLEAVLRHKPRAGTTFIS